MAEKLRLTSNIENKNFLYFFGKQKLAALPQHVMLCYSQLWNLKNAMGTQRTINMDLTNSECLTCLFGFVDSVSRMKLAKHVPACS